MDLTRPAVALITGATSGFGAACARRFAADGIALVLAGRREDRLQALQRDLSTPVHLLPLDVRDRDAVARALTTLPPPFDAIDVLVNNAGLALGLEPADRVSLDAWETMVDTNIKGLMYVMRAVLPGMAARDRGHIVQLGSVAGTYPYPGGNVYGATKAFVHQLSLNLRADLVGKNIRVTSIEPGMAETEFSEVRFEGDCDRARAVYTGLQALSPDDVADAIHWAVTRPAHVNINRIEVMPTMQAFGPFAVSRRPT
ncbi:SDR family oxidoreductase [Chondromyces apiculatus]|uniref:Short-chain dehydrogenase/reductase SDR n=1 Tax=Chondromyces apiculatus DSM 436 TaxID=1192034 RepID=A0A017TA51_9BACT|nr:SDR family oxidoreductase [Chondromyces apiculatus]EYF05812.1 short-chain dehydrogenase/reductase SDR [Chondromyces apiculatus DSM 436]